MYERVPRWRIAVGLTLGLAAIGVWQVAPVLIVAAMIPMGYVAYSAMTSAVAVDEQLQVTRTITPSETYLGGPVEVTVEIEHTGETPLADVRVVDGVPDRLGVVDGSPRAALGLRPGDVATLSYTVRARHGTFTFEPLRVRTTNLSGASVYTADISPDGDTQLAATLGIDEYPLADQTIRSTGSVATDLGGSGLEFFNTRAYQPGDPVNRIDWRQYAERRELTTVEYRQEEAVEVVVIVDARPAATVASDARSPTGVELSAYAASEAIDGLVTARNRVGLVTLGVTDGEPTDGFGWIPPDHGPKLRTLIRNELEGAVSVAQQYAETADDDPISGPTTTGAASSEATAETAPDGGTEVEIDGSRIVERLSPRTQVVVFTPACDAAPATLIQQLRSAGHAVSVCSPNVTAGVTPGSMLARIERTVRLTRMRKHGATVVDWTPEDSLAVVLERAVLRRAEYGATVSTGGPP